MLPNQINNIGIQQQIVNKTNEDIPPNELNINSPVNIIKCICGSTEHLRINNKNCRLILNQNNSQNINLETIITSIQTQTKCKCGSIEQILANAFLI